MNANEVNTVEGDESKNKVFVIDVEKIIASKNPGLLKVLPGFITRYLKRVIHQDEINRFLVENHGKKGFDFSRAILHNYGITYKAIGLENIPADGRFVFASNHPLGGMDGIVFITAVGERFPNLKFPVNDILMNIKGLDNIFVPINKHGRHSREAAALLDKVYSSADQVLMFPAGLVSRKKKGEIKDLEWKSNFLKKAIQYQRDIVPVHMTGSNTNFFYNLANWRKRLGIKANIEMLYLADEFYKIKEKNIVIRFGKPVPWTIIKEDGDLPAWCEKCRDLSYNLSKIN